MQKKVVKGEGSFYSIDFVFSSDDYKKAQEKALKNFQKDISLPGFRKGFVPLSKVQEQIDSHYLTLAIYEHLVHFGLQEVIGEYSSVRFIGEPYDLKQEKSGEDIHITLKLDIFPEVEIIDKNRTTVSLSPILAKATQEEIEEALFRLKKNYADYVDTDLFTREGIAKVSLSFLDKEGKEIDTGFVYIGESEFSEFPFFEKYFIGKKKNEVFELSYVQKDFPPTVQCKKSDLSPVKVVFTLVDVKNIVLPDINEATLLKLFGKDSFVKNESDLLNYIDETISAQKFDTELIKKIEEFLQIIKKTYMRVVIPQTLIHQEHQVRIQNLEKRFGSKEKMDAYFTQMGEEKKNVFLQEIMEAAQESLEKFFILQKVAHELSLDINREKPVDLEIEKKLYQKLIGGIPVVSSSDQSSSSKKNSAKKVIKK